MSRYWISRIKLNGINKPTFFIMNLSNRGEQGTHWVAVFFDRYDICYFDSLGNRPDPDIKNDIVELSNKEDYTHLRKFKYNKKKLQNDLESDCGYHSINFIENMCSGLSFKNATNYRKKDIEEDIKYAEEFL